MNLFLEIIKLSHKPEEKWKAVHCMLQDKQPAEEGYQTCPECSTCDVLMFSTR